MAIIADQSHALSEILGIYYISQRERTWIVNSGEHLPI